jgi:hypothetical protein
MRSITILIMTTALLSVPLVPRLLAGQPPSQNPSVVTDRDAEKATGAEETPTGPGDVQERAIRQEAGAAGESPVCVCVNSAGQCVFSAVHGCVPSQGPVGCNGGCFEQKPQLGKVRPSVPKADTPVLQRRGVETEKLPSSEKEGK